jgi:predicted RNase H-like HicB family nuclease
MGSSAGWTMTRLRMSRFWKNPRTPESEGQKDKQRKEGIVAFDIQFEIILHWSKQDRAFIAEVPELAGCAADGATYLEALANVEVIIREWIETARELGRPVPAPRGRLIFA